MVGAWQKISQDQKILGIVLQRNHKSYKFLNFGVLFFSAFSVGMKFSFSSELQRMQTTFKKDDGSGPTDFVRSFDTD